LIDLLLVTAIVLGALMIAKRETALRTQELRDQLVSTGNALSNTISAKLAQRVVMGKALAAVVLRNPDLSQAEYEFFVSRIGSEDADIRNVAVSPGLVVKFVYPVGENNAVVGADLSKIERMMPAIDQAIAARNPAISDVIDLIQGGPGMILRIPIFRESTETDEGAFWGLVSIVMRHDVFFDEVLRPQEMASVSAAVRSNNPESSSSANISGNAAVFSQDPVLLGIDVPSGTWELALVPAEGWPRVGPLMASYSLFILLLCSVGVSTVHLIWKLRNRGMIARRRLHDAIEALDDGFVLYDAQDRFQLSNEPYIKNYGKDVVGNLRGTTFAEVLKESVSRGLIIVPPGEESSWFDQRIANHRDGVGSFEQQLADGRWVRIYERRTSDGGTVGVHVDITDLRKAREDAEQASRATTEFLNNINHEMRTPLSVILGFNSFLAKPELLPSFTRLSAALQEPMAEPETLREAFAKFEAELRAHAGRIQRSGQHLLHLVNDTLDLALIQNQALHLKRESVDLDALMHECEQQMVVLAQEKHLELKVSCEPVYLEIDPARMRQALINLIGNAIKFTDHGHVHVTSSVNGKSVRISVADTGVGIDQAHQERIFERFWQGDSSATRRHSGTGLGLAITRQLVELHGGRIELESELGVGSTFSIILPMDRPDRADQDTSPALRKAG
jgi:signal transduction histidine kinase